MALALNEAVQKLLLDAITSQFLNDTDQAIQDGSEILKRAIMIPFDENPDNEGQYRELLSVMGKAAREANLLD